MKTIFQFSKTAITLAMFGSFVPALFADVTGKVTLKGTPPNPDAVIRTGGDPKCKHTDEFKSENWKTGADGALADVVVSVEKAEGGKPAETKTIINQQGCRYVPHVSVVVKGSTVGFKNSDPTLHNVHATEPRGKGERPKEIFNMPQIGARVDDKKFEQPQIVRLDCAVHPWMLGWLVVCDNPFFAISGADGTFKLPSGLADGDYNLRAWHSTFPKPMMQIITVKAGAATANFEFNTADLK